EKFSKAFDLPALPNLDKGKEIIDEAVEGGKEAAKELADQLEKAMGLEKFRGDFLKFVSEKCPAVAPQAQKWLDNMTAAHIIEIAKEDGFTEDQIITLWLPKIMSEGGPYALLRRVSGKDMPEGGVPGIVYFFLNASNKQEAIGMGVKALPEALDEFKPIISGVINEVTKNPGDAAGFFENLLDMNTITSTLFGGLKEDVHLATEAVNSSWWMKGYVKEI
ncbi:MAG: hypothetical protein Q8P95_04615, partial [bacterium]|nr:hypothetical protein [bacterium]